MLSLLPASLSVVRLSPALSRTDGSIVAGRALQRGDELLRVSRAADALHALGNQAAKDSFRTKHSLRTDSDKANRGANGGVFVLLYRSFCCWQFGDLYQVCLSEAKRRCYCQYRYRYQQARAHVDSHFPDFLDRWFLIGS